MEAKPKRGEIWIVPGVRSAQVVMYIDEQSDSEKMVKNRNYPHVKGLTLWQGRDEQQLKEHWILEQTFMNQYRRLRDSAIAHGWSLSFDTNMKVQALLHAVAGMPSLPKGIPEPPPYGGESRPRMNAYYAREYPVTPIDKTLLGNTILHPDEVIALRLEKGLSSFNGTNPPVVAVDELKAIEEAETMRDDAYPDIIPTSLYGELVPKEGEVYIYHALNPRRIGERALIMRVELCDTTLGSADRQAGRTLTYQVYHLVNTEIDLGVQCCSKESFHQSYRLHAPHSMVDAFTHERIADE